MLGGLDLLIHKITPETNAIPQRLCFLRDAEHNEKKCTHYVRFILSKISKIGATRCQILRLKCTKFDFHWAMPQTHWGSLQLY